MERTVVIDSVHFEWPRLEVREAFNRFPYKNLTHVTREAPPGRILARGICCNLVVPPVKQHECPDQQYRRNLVEVCHGAKLVVDIHGYRGIRNSVFFGEGPISPEQWMAALLCKPKFAVVMPSSHLASELSGSGYVGWELSVGSSGQSFVRKMLGLLNRQPVQLPPWLVRILDRGTTPVPMYRFIGDLTPGQSSRLGLDGHRHILARLPDAVAAEFRVDPPVYSWGWGLPGGAGICCSGEVIQPLVAA